MRVPDGNEVMMVIQTPVRNQFRRWLLPVAFSLMALQSIWRDLTQTTPVSPMNWFYDVLLVVLALNFWRGAIWHWREPDPVQNPK